MKITIYNSEFDVSVDLWNYIMIDIKNENSKVQSACDKYLFDFNSKNIRDNMEKDVRIIFNKLEKQIRKEKLDKLNERQIRRSILL